jgi:predicted AlkP superfamily phosphohydrolase/phosphomutase
MICFRHGIGTGEFYFSVNRWFFQVGWLGIFLDTYVIIGDHIFPPNFQGIA